MRFIETVDIEVSPDRVFDFLARKHEHTRPAGSPVRRLDKTTPGPVGLGTGFVEDVRMIPGVVRSIRSEVTVFEPAKALGETFEGAGLAGTMRYKFEDIPGGTRLTHEQRMRFTGLYAVLNPILLPFFRVAMRRRLRAIKAILESRRPEGGDAAP